MVREPIVGQIEFHDVDFKYDTRSEYLFKGFCLKIEYGAKSAFVGTSGCGKSSIVSLLLRFYEIEAGQITLGGIDIKDYDIHFLRGQFGVVSQEPLLFMASFRDNIRYNLPLSQLPEQEVYKAAQKAHATEFILGDEAIEVLEPAEPNTEAQASKRVANSEEQSGFDRQVGIKGSHISGGQKQRVSIARAILRHPNILLLDQATSALDSKNEKKVQDALDKVMDGKTTISIAHRLETIRNSKVIFVFDKGRIAEMGTYEELMHRKGYFYNLEKGVEFK